MSSLPGTGGRGNRRCNHFLVTLPVTAFFRTNDEGVDEELEPSEIQDQMAMYYEQVRDLLTEHMGDPGPIQIDFVLERGRLGSHPHLHIVIKWTRGCATWQDLVRWFTRKFSVRDVNVEPVWNEESLFEYLLKEPGAITYGPHFGDMLEPPLGVPRLDLQDETVQPVPMPTTSRVIGEEDPDLLTLDGVTPKTKDLKNRLSQYLEQEFKKGTITTFNQVERMMYTHDRPHCSFRTVSALLPFPDRQPEENE